MQKYFFILLLLLMTNMSYSQKVDYLDIRKGQYLSACGYDSQATFKANKMLLSVDTKKIDKNLDAYYYDLGQVYYKMSLHTHNKKYMDTAVRMYKKALKLNPTNFLMKWDCGIALVFSRHCKEGLRYIDEYAKLAPPNLIDTEAIAGMKDICNGKK